MARGKIDAQQRQACLEEWLRAHGGQVYRTAWYYMQDPAAAADVMQDVFLLAHRHMEALRRRGAPAAWLTRITARRAQQVLRTRGQRRLSARADWQARAERMSALPAPDVADADRVDLMQALAILDDKLRRVLLLHEYYGFRAREIAWLENSAPAAVRKRLERGRRRLAAIAPTEGRMAVGADKRQTTLRALGAARGDSPEQAQARAARVLAAVRADAPGRPDQRRRLPRKWLRRRSTPLDWALHLVIVVCFVAGLLLILKTPYEYYMRSRTADQLRDAFLSGGVIEVGADAWAIPGEETETPVIRETRPTTAPRPTEPGASTPAPTETEPEETYTPPTVVIEPIALIAIPRIDKVGDAVLEGATDVTLRYGIGRYEPSAPIGAEGRTVLLGHKMKYYGVYFSRLQEMQVGDTFTITTRDTSYTYRVFAVESIYKDLLMGKIFAPVEGRQCLLVTCDFRFDPQGDDRLLVHAELESTIAH